ncbi:hypothetical protein POM88_003757 [Heracleum sosnowskyi]|uniref:BED-type domain-containing protein n=1 Tax=Heracleum sosnowskyi TaxID=360622 RepID=A0AAD8JGV6_9APIA|nr:hypothetical protein POM88_003757 [Heracleum sosnowskyi]
METYFANVTQTPSLIPTPNTTPNTSHTAPNTDPTPTAPTNDPMIIQDDNAPIEFKSPKKEADDEAHILKKKPVRTSDIWDYFTKVAGGNPQDPRCTCNYCGADYACHSRRVGTSSLWGHLKKCKKNPHRAADKRQKVLSFHRTTDGGSNLLAATFNKVRCRNALAKFVEGEGFKEFINELQPKFVVPSRITVARDVYNLFIKERAKLKEELTTAGQRVEGILQRLFTFYNVETDVADNKDVGLDCPPKAAARKEPRRRRLLENYLQQQKMKTSESKNDVDRYLIEETINPMTSAFDILVWWKDNSSRYKTLSLIARDVLDNLDKGQASGATQDTSKMTINVVEE